MRTCSRAARRATTSTCPPSPTATPATTWRSRCTPCSSSSTAWPTTRSASSTRSAATRSSTRSRAPPLLGARGVSGLIASQLIRGAAEELVSRPGELVDPVLIGAAMAPAAQRAYGSARQPACSSARCRPGGGGPARARAACDPARERRRRRGRARADGHRRGHDRRPARQRGAGARPSRPAGPQRCGALAVVAGARLRELLASLGVACSTAGRRSTPDVRAAGRHPRRARRGGRRAGQLAERRARRRGTPPSSPRRPSA